MTTFECSLLKIVGLFIQYKTNYFHELIEPVYQNTQFYNHGGRFLVANPTLAEFSVTCYNGIIVSDNASSLNSPFDYFYFESRVMMFGEFEFLEVSTDLVNFIQ